MLDFVDFICTLLWGVAEPDESRGSRSAQGCFSRTLLHRKIRAMSRWLTFVDMWGKDRLTPTLLLCALALCVSLFTMNMKDSIIW
jgi:hypothetical protein